MFLCLWKTFIDGIKQGYREEEAKNKPYIKSENTRKDMPKHILINAREEVLKQFFVKKSISKKLWNPENLSSEPQEIINGWKLLGVFVYEKTKPKLKQSFGENIPENYFVCPQKCDWCKREIFRRYTFVIENIESGEIKQVGSSCIKKFLEAYMEELK